MKYAHYAVAYRETQAALNAACVGKLFAPPSKKTQAKSPAKHTGARAGTDDGVSALMEKNKKWLTKYPR